MPQALVVPALQPVKFDVSPPQLPPYPDCLETLESIEFVSANFTLDWVP